MTAYSPGGPISDRSLPLIGDDGPEIVTFENLNVDLVTIVAKINEATERLFLMEWFFNKLYISELIARLEHWKAVI